MISSGIDHQVIVGWQNLDAAMIALDVQNLGSGEAALWVWDAITQ